MRALVFSCNVTVILRANKTIYILQSGLCLLSHDTSVFERAVASFVFQAFILTSSQRATDYSQCHQHGHRNRLCDAHLERRVFLCSAEVVGMHITRDQEDARSKQ